MGDEIVGVSELFDAVATLATALGAAPLNRHERGLIHTFDGWTIAVNGTDAVLTVEPAGCMAWDVEPFHVVVWWNGWFAGDFTMSGGTLVAGAAANEDALIDAVRAEIARVMEDDDG